MNELVSPQAGLLVPTVFTKSEEGTELGPLAHLNGHVSAEGLCEAVSKGFALSKEDKEKKQAAARAAYMAEKAAFLHRAGQLKAFLKARAQQQRRKWRKP